jgi:mono/diheme cytochrome c family protein
LSRRNSPRWLAAAALALAVPGSLGCWEQVSYDWFPQMKRQIAVQAFEDTGVAGHPQGFTPPEGSVPAGAAGEPNLAALGFAEQDAVPNPVPMTLASLENGKKLYTRTCITCHGPEGKGDGPVAGPPFGTGPLGLVLPVGGPASVVRALSDGHIYTTMTLGRGRMPSYRRIPARERWDIVNYIRQLNGQGLVVAQGGAQ